MELRNGKRTAKAISGRNRPKNAKGHASPVGGARHVPLPPKATTPPSAGGHTAPSPAIAPQAHLPAVPGPSSAGPTVAPIRPASVSHHGTRTAQVYPPKMILNRKIEDCMTVSRFHNRILRRLSLNTLDVISSGIKAARRRREREQRARTTRVVRAVVRRPGQSDRLTRNPRFPLRAAGMSAADYDDQWATLTDEEWLASLKQTSPSDSSSIWLLLVMGGFLGLLYGLQAVWTLPEPLRLSNVTSFRY